MATQRELIYTTRTLLRAGLITDDDKISDRQIAFMHDYIRALLIRRQCDKGQSVSDTHIQHLKCFELESVNTSFDPNFNLDCKVYRTLNKVPGFIETKQKDLVTRVSSPEFGGQAYDLIPYERLPYARSTRFKGLFAVLFDQRIYVIDSPYLEKINISGVFENPNDLANFKDCSSNQCYDWDQEYPLSLHLIDDLIKLTLSELEITLKIATDRVNNSTDLPNQPNNV